MARALKLRIVSPELGLNSEIPEGDTALKLRLPIKKTDIEKRRSKRIVTAHHASKPSGRKGR